MTRSGLPLLVLAMVLAGCAGDQPSPQGVSADSGITGVIVAGPACPVQQEPPASCVEQPVQADVIVRAVRTGAVVATVRPQAGGRFSVALGPGQYELTAQHERGVPLLVNVPANTWVPATVHIDTGIR